MKLSGMEVNGFGVSRIPEKYSKLTLNPGLFYRIFSSVCLNNLSEMVREFNWLKKEAI